MKNKKTIIIAAIFLTALFLGFLLINSSKPAESEFEKPVKIMAVKEEMGKGWLEYSGIVKPVEIKKYSFKLSGVLKDLLVSQGQEVSPGQILARLETKEVEMGLSAASNNLKIAKSSLDFSQDNYQKMLALKEAGGISVLELDRARLEMENAEALYKNAQIDFANRSLNMEDSILKSDSYGYVAEILNQEGELVASGYPVVVLRSLETEITFGLAAKDLSKLKQSDQLLLEFDGKEFTGLVKSISQNPDAQLGTFQTKVIFKIKDDQETPPPAGSIVNVMIPWEEEMNIWIPLTVILNDGQDFVYLMDKEMIVHKKTIQIEKLNKTMAAVSGLKENDFVVIEGYKNLRDGDRVAINN